MPASDLFDAARELLDACLAAVATTDAGAIDTAYVSPGPPALDCCPQLTVHVGGALEADTSPLSPPLQPGHRTPGTSVLPLTQLTATVVRCVPGWDEEADQPPAPAALELAAQDTNADLWAIWNELRRAHRAGSLFTAPAGPNSREFYFDAAFPVNAQGACAGWSIPFRVSLGGY